MSQIFGPLQASYCHFTILVSCSSLFSSLPLVPTWPIFCFLESFETVKTKTKIKSLLFYCPYNLLFTDWFYSQFPQYWISYFLPKFSKQSYFQPAVGWGSFILCLRKLLIILSLSFFFSKPDTIFSSASLIHVFFSCQTNLYVVSSPAFGCNHPLTRLQSHSSLQTSCSFVSLRHPVSCLISPIFWFLTFDPNSPPSQSYCCLYLFINAILFLPHSSACHFPLCSLEKSLREGQGQINQTTQDGQVLCLWLWW